jgi:glycine cleavage system H protein
MNPESLRYTMDHEWVGEQNGMCVVGITDYAQEQLGDVTYVELPKIGQKLKRGEEAAVVESVKAASDVYAPLSGEVAEINEQVENETDLVNRDPYGRGWFFKLKNYASAEYAELMTYTAYRAFCQGR